MTAPRSIGRQFAAFLVVGSLAFVVHYGTMIVLVEAFGVGPVVAALTGYASGGLVSYVMNRRHTYASDRPHAEATPRFGLVAAIGFGLTWLMMAVLTGRFGVPYLPAQVLTTGIVLFWNFFANRTWTFARR